MAFIAKLQGVNVPKQQLLRQLVLSILQKVNYKDDIANVALNPTSGQLKSPRQLIAAQGELQLVKRTTQQLLKEINSLYDTVLCVDVRKLQRDQLEALFRNSLEEKNRQDVYYLVNECMRWSVHDLSTEVCLEILGYYESIRQMDHLEKFYDFLLGHPETISLLRLRLFKVRLYWTEGNTDRALGLLAEIYHATRLRSTDSADFMSCREMLLSLIGDVIGRKSEAVLLKLVHLIETLDDVAILERVWNELFISEWFSDQQLAQRLFRAHFALRLRISLQTNYVTFLLLREHNVDAVYRLIELLLAYEMRDECQKVLGLLFDYQCEDLCIEIVVINTI